MGTEIMLKNQIWDKCWLAPVEWFRRGTWSLKQRCEMVKIIKATGDSGIFIFFSKISMLKEEAAVVAREYSSTESKFLI